MEKSSINSAMIFQEMIRKAEQQIKNLERNELVSIEITVREKDHMFGYDGLITPNLPRPSPVMPGQQIDEGKGEIGQWLMFSLLWYSEDRHRGNAEGKFLDFGDGPFAVCDDEKGVDFQSLGVVLVL